MGEFDQIASNLPWYGQLTAGGIITAVLMAMVKRWLSKENVITADDKATIRSIDIYKGMLDEALNNQKFERELRLAAEDRYDQLLARYAELSGEVSNLRIQVLHQKEALDRQEQIIASLRDEIYQMRGSQNV